MLEFKLSVRDGDTSERSVSKSLLFPGIEPFDWLILLGSQHGSQIIQGSSDMKRILMASRYQALDEV